MRLVLHKKKVLADLLFGSPQVTVGAIRTDSDVNQ